MELSGGFRGRATRPPSRQDSRRQPEPLRWIQTITHRVAVFPTLMYNYCCSLPKTGVKSHACSSEKQDLQVAGLTVTVGTRESRKSLFPGRVKALTNYELNQPRTGPSENHRETLPPNILGPKCVCALRTRTARKMDVDSEEGM